MIMNRNTQEVVQMDRELTNLQRGTRTSPIYKRFTSYEERLPRPPLPSDGHTHISSTLGLLHAYRLHHAKMFLLQHHRKKAVDRIVGRNYVDLDTVDIQLDEQRLKGSYDTLQRFINRVREEFKVTDGTFGFQQKADIL
uniref:Isoleucine--tRNA ligase n=1 Tax=Lygus hesperus TaxID=30085 RepID=A0A0A9W3T9_LYGHE